MGKDLNVHIARSLNALTVSINAWRSRTVFIDGAHSKSFDTMIARSAHDAVDRLIIDILREAAHVADKATGAEPSRTVALGCALSMAAMNMLLAGECVTHVNAAIIRSVATATHALSNASKRCRWTDVKHVISSLLSDDDSDMLCEAAELAGSGGKIVVDVSHVATPVVELTGGHAFDTVQPFMNVVDATSWSGHDVKIVLIDGFIESTSQIDHILSEAHVRQDALVIFARNFHPDVLNTLAVNNRRNTLNVLPVIVPYDAASANVLKDIAVVVGGGVTSSLLGQLISTIRYDDLTSVEQLDARDGKVVISCTRTAADVDAHIERLRSEMSGDDKQFQREFTANRIRSLSSRTVTINIPKANVVGFECIDRTLRQMHAAITEGISSTLGSSASFGADDSINAAITGWLHDLGAVEPTKTVIAALNSAASAARLISTAGAMLIK